MCGIFGVVGLRSDLQRRAVLFRALAVLNESRGEHSHGVAAIDADTKAYKLVKRAGKASKVADFRAWRNAVMSSADVLIGHNRFATHGDVTDVNAHPFRIGSVIGSHNGVCHNTEILAPLIGNKKYPVDSQYLIHMLDVHGNIGPARGSLNLAWWSSKWATGEVLRLQKAGNPLHFWESKTGDGFAYSSEYAHLQRAMAIAGNFGKGEIYYMSDYSELSVFLRSGRTTTHYVQHKPVEAPYTVTNYYQGSGARGGAYADYDGYDVAYTPTRTSGAVAGGAASKSTAVVSSTAGKVAPDSSGRVSAWRLCEWCDEYLKAEKFATPASRVCIECRKAGDAEAATSGAAVSSRPRSGGVSVDEGATIDAGGGNSAFKAVAAASSHGYTAGERIVCKYATGANGLIENGTYAVESCSKHARSGAHSVRVQGVQGSFLTYRFQSLAEYTDDKTSSLRARREREQAADVSTHATLVADLERAERTVLVLMDIVEREADGEQNDAARAALKRAERAHVDAQSALDAWEAGDDRKGGADDMRAAGREEAAAEARKGAGADGSDLPLIDEPGDLFAGRDAVAEVEPYAGGEC